MYGIELTIILVNKKGFGLITINNSPNDIKSNGLTYSVGDVMQYNRKPNRKQTIKPVIDREMAKSVDENEENDEELEYKTGAEAEDLINDENQWNGYKD